MSTSAELATKVASTQAQDPALAIFHEVETYNFEAAQKHFADLEGQVTHDVLRQGGILTLIERNKWYKEQGFNRFSDFVENSLHFDYRKARYLVAIYRTFSELHFDGNLLAQLGVSKLRLLTQVVNQDNVAEWLEKAIPVSVVTLGEMIKMHTQGVDDSVEVNKPAMVKIVLNMHEEQAEVFKSTLDAIRQYDEAVNFDNEAAARMAMLAADAMMAEEQSQNPEINNSTLMKFFGSLSEHDLLQALSLIEQAQPTIAVEVSKFESQEKRDEYLASID